MKTPPQSGAGRARPNASTGPRSAEGKARSSMNALKSGIYAKSLTIPGEDPAHLDTLLQEYVQRYRPALPEQRDQVDILVRSTWNLRRLAAAEAQVWIYEMDIRCELHPTAPMGQAFHFCDRTLTRLQRMVNSTQRNFRDALHELERLQAGGAGGAACPGQVEDLPHYPDPAPAKAPPPNPQPIETEPISPSRQFVPSSSPRPSHPAQKAAPKAPQNPLPFHLPGSHCYYSPIDKTAFKRCPHCFPDDCYPEDQE